ncbi:MAG: aldose 1-epimerase family protein [Lachnospiraceae bacterium]|nr:aldose 1-epimerase family protein [Lachnospiraceae bacterium]
MKKQDILRHVGHMSQIAEIREISYQEGRAKGMNGWQIKNGPLSFTVMKDKGLDISELSYKGINMSFLSKPGLQGRNHYDINGQEAQRSIMGGMIFTCGLENICAPYIGDREYPMHGRIRTTPAEHTGEKVCWEGDEYHLSVCGEMREAELFGENLVLKRKISTIFPGKQIIIEDEIENQGFREEPAMLLYHFNVGYPLLEEGAKIILPTKKITPRDEAAASFTEKYCIMEAPKDQEPEYVFLHELAEDGEGNTFAAVINEKTGFGIRLDFNRKNLPYFMEWKSLASGDYVVGLEPANSSVYGRAYHEEKGDLHTIKPFARENNRLVITILEGEELARTQEEAQALAGKKE